MPRPWGIGLLGASAFLCSGCSSGPPRVVVPQVLVGTWEGQATGETIEFTDSSIFVVEMRGVESIIGRCSLASTRMTLRYQLGSVICPEEPGQYTWAIDGAVLTFTDPVDSCKSRMELLGQSWRRKEAK